MDTTSDHYVYTNVGLINNNDFTNFHFEVYVPATSPKWDAVKNSGCRFHLRVKPLGGDSAHWQFGDNVTVTSGTNYHLDVDTWMSYDIDISGFNSDNPLECFDFYMAYGTEDAPATMYLTNVYVE